VSSATPPLPVVVIGGYLGAGKTTLVNHLLRHAGGRRIAVLVNDFGEISIDADLIVRIDAAQGEPSQQGEPGAQGLLGNVLSLAGGCICCSFGADLVSMLMQMVARRPRPDLVLIETSGVGLPAAVARTAKLAPGLVIEGIVVLADASAVRRQAGERHVGDTVRQQLHEADLVIAGKADIVDAEALAALIAWLRDAGVRAPIVPAHHGAVAPEVVLGLRAPQGREAMDADGSGNAGADAGTEAGTEAGTAVTSGDAPARHLRRLHRAGDDASARYLATTQRFEQAVDVAALGAALADAGVLRAKGLLLDVSGQWQELHVVGRRVDLRPWPSPAGEVGAGASPASAAGRLVSISLRDG
jgi:G3E family GTPase